MSGLVLPPAAATRPFDKYFRFFACSFFFLCICCHPLFGAAGGMAVVVIVVGVVVVVRGGFVLVFVVPSVSFLCFFVWVWVCLYLFLLFAWFLLPCVYVCLFD